MLNEVFKVVCFRSKGHKKFIQFSDMFYIIFLFSLFCPFCQDTCVVRSKLFKKKNKAESQKTQ